MALDPVTARELSRAAAQAKTWTEKRDQLIRDALAAGAGLREVARAVDIDHSTLHSWIKRGKL